ncbi:MAG: hypothetical protein QM724_00435 [Flavobacteriales bacterium]
MRLVVDVKDSKAELLLKFLRTLSYVKVERAPSEASAEKEAIIASVRQAVEEMKLVKAGKLKGRPVQELLDEL